MRSRIGASALVLLCGLPACLVWTTHLYGEVAFEHLGASDPLGEGWTEVYAPSAIARGPVIDDLGTGTDAWSIDDHGENSDFEYAGFLSAAQTSDAQSFGWTLRANLRVVDAADDPLDSSIVVLYSVPETASGSGDGRIFDMQFGSAVDGDPIVVLVNETDVLSFSLEGSGGGYHLFELRFDAVAQSADLFVDGIERLSDYTGFSSGPGGSVLWGNLGDSGVGHAHFNLVRFEIVPEPSCVTLMLAATAALAWVRFRTGGACYSRPTAVSARI